jgi:signal transduction histidine kinase
VGDKHDITRGELGGGIPVARKPGDFGEAARAIVQDLTLLYPDRQIELDLGGDLLGDWDHHRVAQAMSNLVTNALDHGTGTVTVRAMASGDEVILSVHNEGGVIPAHLLETLFQPFRHGTTRSDGLGLGLYIVREIVRAHGGQIEARSSSAEGTTFRSTWPRR